MSKKLIHKEQGTTSSMHSRVHQCMYYTHGVKVDFILFFYMSGYINIVFIRWLDVNHYFLVDLL